VLPPRFDLALRVRQRQEPERVQTAVERLHNKRVVGRLAGPAEVEPHVILVSPAVNRLGDELWPIAPPPPTPTALAGWVPETNSLSRYLLPEARIPK
jgi:hypothetical protein